MRTVAVVSQDACIRTHKLSSIVENYKKVLLTPLPIDAANAAFYDQIVKVPRLDTETFLRLNPDLIHYHNEPNQLAYLLLENVPQIPLIFDCHDMVSLARDSADPVEEFIFEKAAGVIHVNEALEERARKQFTMRESAVFCNYVSQNYFADPKRKKIGDVVYQGGFGRMANTHRNLGPLFQTFGTGGYTVDIYPSSPQKDVVIGAKVTMHQPLPYRELMGQLGKYQYGFVGHPDGAQDYGSEFLDAALPNKFFEYLAAGLPVIVYKAALVAKIVEEEKIGVVLEKPEDISVLEDVDYDQLVENVVAARRKFVLEQQGERLEAFYERVLSKAGSYGKVGRNDPCPCGSGKKFKRCCG